MTDGVNWTGKFLERFQEIIGEAVRQIAPGLLLLVLLMLNEDDVVGALFRKADHMWAWTLVLAWVAGVVVYTIHRYVIHFFVECVLTWLGVTPIAKIRKASTGMSFAQAKGQFWEWRFGQDFVDKQLSKQLFNTWAFNHLLWIIGELVLVVSVKSLKMPFSLSPRWAGGTLMLIGFIQSWHLFRVETEIWRQENR